MKKRNSVTEIDPAFNARLCGMLGLAARARRLAVGTELVTQTVRAGKAHTVIVAHDASDNTKKRIFNCCQYYECECLEAPISSSGLANAVGKTGLITTVAVTDAQMTKGIRKIYGSLPAQQDVTDGKHGKNRSQEV